MKVFNFKREKNKKNYRKKRGRSKWYSKYFRLVLILTILLLLVFLIYKFLTNPQAMQNYTYKNTEYSGIENLEASQIESELDDYKGEVIFKLQPDKIESQLSNEFIQIETVRVEKIFPDTLMINIVEKVPQFLYINFNGSYIIDEEGEVLKSKSAEDEYKFSKEDYLLARGLGSVNSDIVEDHIVANLEEEEVENFMIENYPLAEKQNVLRQIVDERKMLFEEAVRQQREDTDLNDELNLPEIEGWNEKKYREGESLPGDLVDFLKAIVTELSSEYEGTFTRYLWDGQFQFIAESSSGSRVIFSTERDYNFQLEDLDLVLQSIDKDINEVSVIDLTTDKVLVH